jgi:hypothetical protein
MRVELKDAQGAVVRPLPLLLDLPFVLFNDDILMVMHTERIFLASDMNARPQILSCIPDPLC